MVTATAENPQTGERLLFVGLSLEDLKNLSYGKPLAIDMAKLQEGITNIMIFGGTTDEEIRLDIEAKVGELA